MERVLRSCNNFIEQFSLQNPLGLFLENQEKMKEKRKKSNFFSRNDPALAVAFMFDLCC